MGKPTILITGGTGFIGRNLALALRHDSDVVLGARNHQQISAAETATGCTALPLDVVNIESVRDVHAEVRPDIVIHAAATKFVDLAERLPLECIDVNVVGSQNVARVAIEKNVKIVLGISTDKAAPPVRNTYGLSKALMERLFCSMNGKTDTRFGCVRFGNVAWSTGSVFPIWNKMHGDTGVIHSTGPEMQRFFFSVGEAVRLVRTAIDHFDLAEGKVLSRQMKAAQIGDILDLWIKHKGGRWERTEGRPGERIDEFLIGELELPYTRRLVLDGLQHFLIAFNEKSTEPPVVALSSANAERLSNAEMLKLINGAPVL